MKSRDKLATKITFILPLITAALFIISNNWAIYLSLAAITFVSFTFLFFLVDMIRNIRGRVSLSIIGFILSNVGSIIFLFGNVYRWTGLHYPNDGPSNIHDFWGAVYFSTVTWTTLGYGDVTPYPESRGVAGAEALLGYVTMALLISVFSAMAQANRSGP